jgi:CheY-like chemotaxis protein/DNA-binding XRE family transcriptional regulator
MAEKSSKYLQVMKSFGKAVRFYRGKLGLSQEALADRAQLDRSYMSQIERGIKNATLNSIWRISQALEAKPSDLLRLTEELVENGEQAIEHWITKFGLDRNGPRTGEPNTILVVDDDVDICVTVDTILQDAGFATRQASSGFDAFQILSQEPVRAVVSDIRMANGNGIELLGAMRKHFPAIPLIFITGYDDVTQEDAKRLGATGLISKPFDSSNFISLVKTSIEAPALV